MELSRELSQRRRANGFRRLQRNVVVAASLEGSISCQTLCYAGSTTMNYTDFFHLITPVRALLRLHLHNSHLEGVMQKFSVQYPDQRFIRICFPHDRYPTSLDAAGRGSSGDSPQIPLLSD